MHGTFRVLALCAIVVVAGCSGGGSSAPATPAAPVGPAGPQTSGSVTITIGGGNATPSSKNARRAQFVSINASSVGIQVGTQAETYTDVSATSSLCTTANNARTCTIPISAPAGTPVISFALYDGPNGSGHLIAAASAQPTVVIGQAFTVTATMAPVVAALTGGSVVYTSGTQFIIGTPETATVTIGAADPDGTAIPSASSFAAGVHLSSSDSHITIAPAVWTSPSVPITLTYDGSVAVANTVTITFANSTATPYVQVPLVLGSALNILEYPIPTSGSEPVGITSGPDGALWFVEQVGNKVGRITTGGAITEYSILTASASPASMTTGSDGNLWFTEEGSFANRIGTINPSTHAITEYTAGISAFSFPYNITSNPTDGNLYFTEFATNKIARITTLGAVTEFTIPTSNTEPSYIVTGPDGALWFTQQGTNQIGRMTTGGVFSETTIPTASSQPSGITVGPDGALWFLEESGLANKVARITTAGVVTNEFVIPTASSGPMTIVTGHDGNLWFTENNNSANKVARMTPAGVFTEFPVPTVNSGPCSITLGPDNAIWFAENNTTGNKIGTI